ncbi:hypothetical protein G7Y89_g4018 [Cudoniella acicularis]|uniref:Heterokaryon incompatibility domain-containing protein n=1 Tax=Cudoniella acicularis TaxID=354080 RepID=A0A8H4RSD9_9HELO|nr:hypothetical protein G7Y89_g4018 [Cudoniella acicularis]
MSACPSPQETIQVGALALRTEADMVVEQGEEAAQALISQGYVYSELLFSSIRLLRLKPGSSPSKFQCELQAFSIDQAPKYHTLSYCWGAPTRENPLLCSGEIIMITTTLKEALARLITHNRGDVEWIWIDQICVDQENVREKETQVNMMKDIYHKSEGTIVWLGPDIIGIESTERLLDDMWHLHTEDQSPIDGSRRRGIYTRAEFEATNLPPAWHPSWKVLAELLSRPWFVRTWVIQEAVLSRAHPQMLCGSYKLDWEKLLASSSWMVSLSYNTTPLSQDTKAWPAVFSLDLFHNLRILGLRWDMATLLSSAIRFKASDPRDKVYSLVSLSGETTDSSNIPTALQANYDKSYIEVFRDVTRYIIESSKSLRILTLIRYVPKSKKLPSWSVDFTQDVCWERMSYLVWDRHESGRPVSIEKPNKASANLPAEVQSSSSEDVLTLGGLLIDIVGAPCETMLKSDLDSFGSRVLFAWKSAYEYTRDRHQDLPRAFMVTLVANWNLTETERMEHQPLCNFWAYLWRVYEELLNVSENRRAVEEIFHPILEPQNPDNPGDPDLYRLHLNGAYHRRMFFTKHKCYLGLGPCTMQENDILCVLFGGSTPLILRPEGDYFRFVGECYVYDLMNGEAVTDWKAGNYVAQYFHLI